MASKTLELVIKYIKTDNISTDIEKAVSQITVSNVSRVANILREKMH